MKRIMFVVILFLLSITQMSYAACNSFSCAESGGTCVNGVCVPNKPAPPTTPIPVSVTASLVQIAKLYCVPGELCIIVVSPPDFIGKLVLPIVPTK